MYHVSVRIHVLTLRFNTTIRRTRKCARELCVYERICCGLRTLWIVYHYRTPDALWINLLMSKVKFRNHVRHLHLQFEQCNICVNAICERVISSPYGKKTATMQCDVQTCVEEVHILTDWLSRFRDTHFAMIVTYVSAREAIVYEYSRSKLKRGSVAQTFDKGYDYFK